MAINLTTQFRLMAQYNTWMNRGIYDTCASLTDEERKRDLHAYFVIDSSHAEPSTAD